MFEQCKTIDELKKAYRAMAKKAHPDMPGGSEELMKKVNVAYEERLQELARESHSTKSNDSNQRQSTWQDVYRSGIAFREALEKIISLEGLFIEICGSWIWVAGNTYQHKEQLKESGYKYSGAKKKWYWADGLGEQKRKGQYTMQEIRAKYGSEHVASERVARLSA